MVGITFMVFITFMGDTRGFRDYIAFEKLNFQIAFRPYEKKAGVFKILPFEEHFRKALLSWRISVHGGPNRRNKADFSKFSGVES